MSDDAETPDLGLVDAWPRVCGCGRSYTACEWTLLFLVGEMVDDVESIEMRNCKACGSTIAMTIEASADGRSLTPPQST